MNEAALVSFWEVFYHKGTTSITLLLKRSISTTFQLLPVKTLHTNSLLAMSSSDTSSRSICLLFPSETSLIATFLTSSHNKLLISATTWLLFMNLPLSVKIQAVFMSEKISDCLSEFWKLWEPMKARRVSLKFGSMFLWSSMSTPSQKMNCSSKR